MRSHPILPLILAAAVWSAVVAPSSVQAQNKGTALDDFLRYPGDYSQICSLHQFPFPAPIPGFRMLMRGATGYSTERVEAMKQNRAALIPAIAARLEKVDLTREPQPQPPDGSIPENQVTIDPVGVDPASYSTLLLAMIEELGAREVFPQLMRVEEKIHDMLLVMEKDPAAPQPQVDGTEGASMFPETPEATLKEGGDGEVEILIPEPEGGFLRRIKLFQAQAAQRDILAVLVRSMRRAGFEPMLKSGLEKTYGNLLKAKWEDDEALSKYKSAADIPEVDRMNVKFDPIHQVAHTDWGYVEIPYSEETRAEILNLTRAYVAGGQKK